MHEVKEKIMTEEKLLNKKTEDLVREWDKEQPQSVIILIWLFFGKVWTKQKLFSKGAIQFTNALETIDRIEVKLTNLKEERKLIAKAKKDLAGNLQGIWWIENSLKIFASAIMRRH